MNGFRDLPDAPDFPDVDSIPDIPDIPSIPDIRSIPGIPNVGASSSAPARGASTGTATPPESSLAASSVAQVDAQPLSVVLGVDSILPSSVAILTNAQSTTYLGAAPQFWGRYFYAPGQINSSGHKDTLYSAQENAMLRAKNIRVLPIARQTGHVVDPNKAKDDAARNVAAIFETFPAAYLSAADPDVLVFLDTEPETPLSAGYYEAWSATIISEAAKASNGRVRFHPALYGNYSDDETWTALNQAIGDGAPCDGIWMARYYYKNAMPRPWSDKLTTPSVKPLCPILAWQYWASADDAKPAFNFDTTITSPPHADMLMSRLAMPPA